MCLDLWTKYQGCGHSFRWGIARCPTARTKYNNPGVNPYCPALQLRSVPFEDRCAKCHCAGASVETARGRRVARRAAQVEITRDEHMTLELETINGERWADSGQAELIVEREEFEGDDRELVGSEGEGNDVEIGKVTFQAWAAVEEAKKPENAAWESEPDEETAAEGEGKARFNPRRWAGKAGKMLKKIRPRTPA